MLAQQAFAVEYDSVELRGGRLHRIRRAQARMLGDDDRMAPVAKCYCDAEPRPTFVFPGEYFKELETLIGKELVGRIYTDSALRRVKFLLDLREHAGFQLERHDHGLHSPWYDDSVLKE